MTDLTKSQVGTGFARAGLGLGALALLLAACSEEPRLPGERLTPAQALYGPDAAPPAQANQALPLALPAPQANGEWTHRGGGVGHRVAHAALALPLAPLWRSDIGAGNERRARIVADPVVGGGRIYGMDARAAVSALAPDGRSLWRQSLVPESDRAGEAIGGGLAYADGRIYATTGYGELLALDAASGQILWRQSLEASVGGAPAVADGMVYVASRDSGGWAVRAADGRVEWRSQGLQSPTGVTGVSAPAVAGDTVIFPYVSGELQALDRRSGQPKWTVTVAGRRLGMAYAIMSDFTGDPVVADGTVYAATASGRMAAVDLASGRVLWTADEGAASPVTVAGGSVFLVSDENRLMRLSARDGLPIWSVGLPYYQPERKEKNRRDIFVHYGPVLAGGQLILASSDGALRSFDPVSGAMTAQLDLPGGAASAPAVAGGVLYVLDRDGRVQAFR